jgi:hypothetical protein
VEIKPHVVYHNGKKDNKYKERKITGFDGHNGVNYIAVSSRKTGNCSIETMKRFAKGVVGRSGGDEQ